MKVNLLFLSRRLHDHLYLSTPLHSSVCHFVERRLLFHIVALSMNEHMHINPFGLHLPLMYDVF